jgi:hypothetical protein
VILPMDTIGDVDNDVVELLDRRRWTTCVGLANAGFA